MSSLRRDLIERKLWIVVALLVVGLIAVPMLLLKSASAGGAPTVPVPPAASTASTTTSVGRQTATPDSSTVPAKVLLARIARNPFASGVPKLSPKPTAATSSSPTAPSTATTSASTTTPSMVSPSPASTSSTASSSSASSGSSTGPSTETPPASSTPTSTIASAPPSTLTDKPARPQSWTTYSVSVRFGKDLSAPVKTDLARLTPLPSLLEPEVMFMGVMSDGQSAVFALHAGIVHTGPGLCRPDHTRCSAIVLKAGETEHLSVLAANGERHQVVLRVVKVASSITHSRSVALAAYHRVNAAGQCELDLANPVSYDSVTGTISSVAKAACENHPNAMPFAYLVTTP